MNYSHLARLTCDYGIIQFAPHGEPDINSGCTTDDNARALLVALNMEGSQREEYANLYCEALQKAWRRGEGWYNWWLPNRGYVTDLDSDDSQGRAFMACCFGAVSGVPGVSAPPPVPPPVSVVESTTSTVTSPFSLVVVVVTLPTVDGRLYEVHDFAATVIDGTLTPGDDAADARWVTPAELDELPLTAGLKDYFVGAGIIPPAAAG